MPELERTADFGGQRGQEIGQQRLIAFQRGRQLEQHRSQPPSGPERIDCLQEYIRELGPLQPLDVSDPHVRLARKGKPGPGRIHQFSRVDGEGNRRKV